MRIFGISMSKGTLPAFPAVALPVDHNFYLKVNSNDISNDIFSFKGFAYNSSVAGPTLVMEQGNKYHVFVENNIDDIPLELFKPHFINTFGEYSKTNIHFHGLQVSPSGMSDNIFRNAKATQSISYELDIPPDHPPGLFFYHPHHHGSITAQATLGLYGAFYVAPSKSTLDNETNSIWKYLLKPVENPLSLQHIMFDPREVKTGSIGSLPSVLELLGRKPPVFKKTVPKSHGDDIPGGLVLVNGHVDPEFTLDPDRPFRLDLINASPSSMLFLYFSVIRGEFETPFNAMTHAGCEVFITALDGVPMSRPHHVQEFVSMPPGSRRQVIGRCSLLKAGDILSVRSNDGTSLYNVYEDKKDEDQTLTIIRADKYISGSPEFLSSNHAMWETLKNSSATSVGNREVDTYGGKVMRMRVGDKGAEESIFSFPKDVVAKANDNGEFATVFHSLNPVGSSQSFHWGLSIRDMRDSKVHKTQEIKFTGKRRRFHLEWLISEAWIILFLLAVLLSMYVLSMIGLTTLGEQRVASAAAETANVNHAAAFQVKINKSFAARSSVLAPSTTQQFATAAGSIPNRLLLAFFTPQVPKCLKRLVQYCLPASPEDPDRIMLLEQDGYLPLEASSNDKLERGIAHPFSFRMLSTGAGFNSQRGQTPSNLRPLAEMISRDAFNNNINQNPYGGGGAKYGGQQQLQTSGVVSNPMYSQNINSALQFPMTSNSPALIMPPLSSGHLFQTPNSQNSHAPPSFVNHHLISFSHRFSNILDRSRAAGLSNKVDGYGHYRGASGEETRRTAACLISARTVCWWAVIAALLPPFFVFLTSRIMQGEYGVNGMAFRHPSHVATNGSWMPKLTADSPNIYLPTTVMTGEILEIRLLGGGWRSDIHPFHLHGVHGQWQEETDELMGVFHGEFADVFAPRSRMRLSDIPSQEEMSSATPSKIQQWMLKWASARIRFKFTLGGAYPLHCHVASHEDLGMMTLLKVKEDENDV